MSWMTPLAFRFYIRQACLMTSKTKIFFPPPPSRRTMLEAVPSGRSRVRFVFRADIFSDGFHGFHTDCRTDFHTETHSAKTNVGEAYEVCTVWLENHADRSGSSVSTFLKTVVLIAFAVVRSRSAELAPPPV